jgi:hypothetical protein
MRIDKTNALQIQGNSFVLDLRGSSFSKPFKKALLDIVECPVGHDKYRITCLNQRNKAIDEGVVIGKIVRLDTQLIQVGGKPYGGESLVRRDLFHHRRFSKDYQIGFFE